MKSNEAHRMRLLLAHRRALKRKAVDLENAVRHTLKAFGVRLHAVGHRQMNGAIADATRHDPLLYDLSQAMLRARDALLAECEAMSLVIRRFADQDPVCKAADDRARRRPDEALSERREDLCGQISDRRETEGLHDWQIRGAPWTVEQARGRACELLFEAQQGEDPQQKKKQRRHAHTVAQLIELYLQEGPRDKPNKRPRSWENDRLDAEFWTNLQAAFDLRLAELESGKEYRALKPLVREG